MTENTTATVDAPELTQAQKDEMFNALPGELQEAITNINASTDEHNAKVDSLKASEAKDPKLIKAEIYEQNSAGNKKLARIRTEELSLLEKVEALRKQAYEIIDTDGLMPKELSEAEIEKLKGEVADSTKELRDQVGAILKFEDMVPTFKGKLSVHMKPISTRRGAAKTTGTTAKGEGPKRPRFKRIEINGVTQDDKGNTVWQSVKGEEKYTFTFAAAYLKKQHKNITWSSSDLQDAYYKGLDENNLPDEHTFEMPFTYKDEAGNDQTVKYTVKAYR
jgi:chromosome segregation ATPase